MGRAVAPAAWGFYADLIILADVDGVLAADVLDDSVSPNEQVAAESTVLPSLEAVGSINSALTEDADHHVLSEHELSDNPFASLEGALPPRLLPLIELAHHQWVHLLEVLHISDPCVSHMALGGGSLKAHSSSAPPADGLVIAAATVSEEKVVHSSLTAGNALEGL